MSTTQTDARLANYIKGARTIVALKSARDNFVANGHVRTMDYFVEFVNDNRLVAQFESLIAAAEALVPVVGEEEAVRIVTAAV